MRPAAHWCLGDDTALPFMLVHRRADPTGTERIHPDPVGRQLERSGLRYRDQRRLACAIGDIADGTDDAEDRGDVDYRSSTALTDQGDRGLDAEKRAGCVDREDTVPVLHALDEERTDVDDPGVVDQHIQAARGRSRMGDRACPLPRRSDIEVQVLDVEPLLAQPGHGGTALFIQYVRSEEHTSELQSRVDLVCRLLLE